MDSNDPVDAAMSAAAGSYAPPSNIDEVEAAMARAASKDAPPTSTPSADKGKFSIGQAALSYGTGALASIGAGYRGLWDLAVGKGLDQASNDIRDTQDRFTVAPNQATQEALASDKNPLNTIPKFADAAGQVVSSDLNSPLFGALTNAGINAFALDGAGDALKAGGSALKSGVSAAAKGVNTAVKSASDIIAGPAPTAEQIVARQAMNSPQSMGAAAASPNVTNVSPELQQAIVAANRQAPGALPMDVLSRHVEADSLPVKIQLTEGQATQDPSILSNEVNARGKNQGLADRYNLQNQQLSDNLQVLRDRVGPDVFSTNQVEHGDALIDAYKAKDTEAQADINQKYQALRDANGATMPIDTGTLVSNVDTQLKKQYLTDSIPPQAKSILDSLRAGEPMDFEGFEAARSRLAEAQRAGGSPAAAAKIIRSNLEDLPLSPEASSLKGLADTARSAARSRFQTMEQDPAYDAAVNGTVHADKFVGKFILNGNKADVATMRDNLSGNDTALQTMGVAALDHLRTQAKVGDGQSGNFAADSYNKALQALGPKADSLVDPQTAETLSALGRVSRNVKGQPAGSFINNSNTFVAQAGEHAANVAEAAANAATVSHGIPIPGGSIVRKVIQGRAANKAAQRSLAPGAGLTRLSDLMSPK